MKFKERRKKENMKLFSKIASAIVGIAMAIGVGVAVSSVDAKGVRADSTASVSIATYASNNSWANDTRYESISLNSEITATASDGTNNGKYFSASPGTWRFYQNESGTLTVSAASGYTLTSVTLTFTVKDSGVMSYSGSNLTSGTAVTVSGSSAVFSAGSSSGSKGKVLVSAISVGYVSGGGGQDDPVLESISVSGEKTAYTVGDEFVKPTVTAHYDDESTQDVTATATCTGYNMGVAGEYTVTVSYGGKTTTYDIVVSEETPEGEVLYSATFTELEAYSYEQNKEFTLNEKTWVTSVSQVNGGVFYLGCNSTHAAKGILNNNDSFSDVVTALAAADTPYGSAVTTAHAYAMRFDNAYENVASVKFTWAGGNNAFQVYLFGDRGSGLEVLAHTDYATSGTAVSGLVRWSASEDAEDFTSFVIVARPGATGSTATNKTLRAATFQIIAGEGKPQLGISDTNREEIFTTYSVTVGQTATLVAVNESRNPVTTGTVDWSVGDGDTLGIAKNGYAVEITGLKEGETTLTATHDDYKSATITVTVEPDPTLPEMEIWDGSSKVDGTKSYVFSTTVGIYKFYAHPAEDSETVLNADSWASSDESVATIERNSDGYGVLTTLAIGETYLTVSKDGYQNATVKITISKGVLDTVVVGGEMTKTSYTTADTEWSSAGLTATAQYNHGYEEDVTSSVTWTFSPASPSGLEGSVNVTPYANYEEESYAGAVQACTVTVSHAGTADDPFTVAEGIAKCQEIGQTASGDWYVKGYITAVTSTAEDADKYGNATFNLADSVASSDILIAFQVKNIGGVAFTTETFNAFAADAVGKIAVVHGPLVNYKGNTPEFNGKGTSSLVSVEDAPTGDIDVTFTAFANCEVGASGTFTASTTATNPVYTWSVDDSTIMTVDASTGVYSAKKVGVVIVTVNVSADEGEGHASVAITVNGSETDLTSIAEANSIAASLGTGKTTSYYVYVGGYVKEFGTSMSGDKPRAFDIMNFDEEYSIMVYTNVDPYEDFVSGLSLGDYVIVKANIQNYGGVYELTSPEKISSEYTGVSFAFELLKQTDAVCSNVEIEDKGAALEEIWPSLETLYNGIDPDLQEDVIYSSADEKGTTLQKAMARYDRLVTKYGLTNFVVGRDPYSLNNSTNVVTNNNNSTSSIVVVTVIALTSISAIAVLLVIKRRKTY